MEQLNPRVCYRKTIPSMAIVSTKDRHGDEGAGTAFHIGDGYYITAKHNVSQQYVSEYRLEGLDGTEIAHEQCFEATNEVDLAVIKTSTQGTLPEPIKINKNSSMAKSAKDLTILDALLFGFPRIPLTTKRDLVVVKCHISAVVNPCESRLEELLILSCTPRGGFSGGPVLLSEKWTLLGVCVNARNERDRDVEFGFAAAYSLYHVLKLLVDNKIAPTTNLEAITAFKQTHNIL